jgi:hypothetical protein
MDGIMNELSRWKENRIRQEIYIEHLKHPKTSPNGTGSNGTKLQGQNGNAGPKSRPEWILLRFTVSAIILAAWFWVYLAESGANHSF